LRGKKSSTLEKRSGRSSMDISPEDDAGDGAEGSMVRVKVKLPPGRVM
jgi:hypothetical protein